MDQGPLRRDPTSTSWVTKLILSDPCIEFFYSSFPEIFPLLTSSFRDRDKIDDKPAGRPRSRSFILRARTAFLQICTVCACMQCSCAGSQSGNEIVAQDSGQFSCHLLNLIHMHLLRGWYS